MPGREPLPDVMGELLGETPEQPDSAPFQRQDSTTARRRRRAASQSREGTKKVTLYFTEDTIAALHQKWIQNLSEDPHVTKSAIVESQLRAWLGLE